MIIFLLVPPFFLLILENKVKSSTNRLIVTNKIIVWMDTYADRNDRFIFITNYTSMAVKFKYSKKKTTFLKKNDRVIHELFYYFFL